MFKQKSILWFTIFLLSVSVTVFFMIGCSSKNVLKETPADTSVNVTASPSSIGINSTTVVEATVSSNSTGLANQIVTFSVSPSTAGNISPAVDTTDASGVAAAVFTATDTGVVSITASVNGTSFSGNIGVSVTSTAQTGSGSINMSVTPSLLLANGSDTSQVTIMLRDANGQPAPDSTMVKIAAGEKFIDIDGNGYWSQGIDSLVFDANNNGQWDAIGLIPSTSFTSGGTGNAVVNYVSGNDALTVYIKATVNDNGIEGDIEQSVQLNPNASINSIYLSADSMNLVVKQTGGIESSLLEATGYDAHGNTVPGGLAVNFIIIDGPGGGEHLGNVGYGPYTAITNSQGVAVAPVHSGTISGTIRIRAYVDTVLSNATQILVSSGPPAHIVVGSEKCNVRDWDVVGDQVPIVAVVSDIYNNPVLDSTVVYFSTDEGTMKSHEERTKDMEGTATTVWISGNNVPTADGRVYIYAETAGGTVADTSMFFNSFYPDTLIVTGMPSSMSADGTSKATIVVVGLDVNNNPVADQTMFKADANYLMVQGGTLADGCYSSSAIVKITSKTLKMDHSTPGGNDDGIGAYDQIVYYSGSSAFTYYTVALTTSMAYSGNSIINASSSVAPSESVSISAVIEDRFGNPLGDHTLNMTASAGTVTGATQETNPYGEASGFIWTAPAVAGSVTITITDTDPRGGIVLTKTISVQS